MEANGRSFMLARRVRRAPLFRSTFLSWYKAMATVVARACARPPAIASGFISGIRSATPTAPRYVVHSVLLTPAHPERPMLNMFAKKRKSMKLHISSRLCQAHAAEQSKSAKMETSRSVGVPKRSSRSRTAAGSGTAAAAGRSSSSSSASSEVAKARDAAKMQLRISVMQLQFGAQLSFLVREFTKMEAQLTPEVGLNTVSTVRSRVIDDARTSLRCCGHEGRKKKGLYVDS